MVNLKFLSSFLLPFAGRIFAQESVSADAVVMPDILPVASGLDLNLTIATENGETNLLLDADNQVTTGFKSLSAYLKENPQRNAQDLEECPVDGFENKIEITTSGQCVHNIKNTTKEAPPSQLKDFDSDMTLFFVIDGSDSVKSAEFERVKIWIHGLVKSLHYDAKAKDSEVFVLLIQFSDDYRLEYAQKIATRGKKSTKALDKFREVLTNMRQMSSKTKLFNALEGVSQLTRKRGEETEFYTGLMEFFEKNPRAYNPEYVDLIAYDTHMQLCNMTTRSDLVENEELKVERPCSNRLLILSDMRHNNKEDRLAFEKNIKTDDNIISTLQEAYDRIDTIVIGDVNMDPSSAGILRQLGVHGTQYHLEDYEGLTKNNKVLEVARNLVSYNDDCVLDIAIIIENLDCECDPVTHEKRFTRAKEFLSGVINNYMQDPDQNIGVSVSVNSYYESKMIPSNFAKDLKDINYNIKRVQLNSNLKKSQRSGVNMVESISKVASKLVANAGSRQNVNRVIILLTDEDLDDESTGGLSITVSQYHGLKNTLRAIW